MSSTRTTTSNDAPKPPRRTWGQFGLYLLAAAGSGVLLGLSFPPAMIWPLAFTALVPWLLVLPRLGLSGTILSSFVVGGIWFSISLGWIANLELIAFPVVAFALSVQMLLFAIPAHYLLRRGTWWGLVGTGAFWLMFEGMRTRLDAPLPFPWLMLGDSQAAFEPMIQIAELGGVALVSALIVTINLALARPLLLKRKRGAAPQPIPDSKALAKRTFASAIGSLALLFVALVYGFVRMEQWRAPDGESLIEGPKIAVTQPNRLHRPDREGPRPSIVEPCLRMLPHAYASQADMIVWPEAVFSGRHEPTYRRGIIGGADGPDADPRRPSATRSLWELMHYDVFPRVHWAIQEAEIYRATQAGEEPPETAPIPIPAPPPPAWPYFLLGTTFKTTIEHPQIEGRYHDRGSADFLSPQGEPLGRYHKQNLVPMGEYVPFLEIGFVANIVRQAFESHQLGDHLPMCLAGEGPAHFSFAAHELAHSDTPPNPFSDDGRYTFAVPICYELAFPHTVRRLVAGPASDDDDADARPADFLINLSDESWYRQSPELMQMLQMAIMRAVENRRAIVRCTNTGISAFIAPSGRMYSVIEDGQGNVVEVGPAVLARRAWVTNVRTPYQVLGDWVPLLALLLGLASLATLIITGRRRKSEQAPDEVKEQSQAANSDANDAEDANEDDPH